ncbi:hypothetical protein ILYODFUR_013654 [Ilyodon furcidens]|uniref:Uncharacterized protein n=1 Tax=Ilyodon furcidens TaxID=33524 RepID=A0ABV0VEF5_9TELE
MKRANGWKHEGGAYFYILDSVINLLLLHASAIHGRSPSLSALGPAAQEPAEERKQRNNAALDGEFSSASSSWLMTFYNICSALICMKRVSNHHDVIDDASHLKLSIIFNLTSA